jgi:predicted NAD/FAD-dependent oxidoreductase
MAGLACAARLAAAGVRPAIFDKGRRPSGRLAGRVIEVGGLAYAFDYGAQYMTARAPAFVDRVRAWAHAGVAAPWPAAGADAWVGTPSMDAPLAAMADPLGVRWSAQVERIERGAAGWSLWIGEVAEGPFDELILALPAEQTQAIAAAASPALATLAQRHRSQPCWTALLAFDRAMSAPPLLGGDGVIDVAVRNPAKPGRADGEAWTVHADAGWSARHLEAPREAIAGRLAEALAARLPGLPAPVHATAHRWRYARSAAAGLGHWRDEAAGLTACGDWLIAPRVESAWLSGTEAAEAILAR